MQCEERRLQDGDRRLSSISTISLRRSATRCARRQALASKLLIVSTSHVYTYISMTPRSQGRKTLRADAAALVADCSGWNSRLAARLITQFVDRELEKTGLSIAQVGLMAEIAVMSDDTLGALAQRTGLEQSTLSRNLRSLERDGLVEIATVAGNLRRRMVWLTETGARRLEAAIPVWRKAQAKLAERLSSRLARQLADAAQ